MVVAEQVRSGDDLADERAQSASLVVWLDPQRDARACEPPRDVVGRATPCTDPAQAKRSLKSNRMTRKQIEASDLPKLEKVALQQMAEVEARYGVG